MLETIEQETQRVVATVIGLLPDVIGALLLLLAGWLVGKFLKWATIRLSRSFNEFLSRHLASGRWGAIRIPASVAAMLGQLLFWMSMLVFLAIAIRVLGFTSAASWLDRLVVYLPSLMAGGLIIVSGFIIGAVARRLVTHAAAAADVAEPQSFGQLAQAAFVVVGLIIGLGQIGVDVTFISQLLGITLAAILAGFALAFGLGARTLVENLIALQHVKQLVKPGQKVQIGEDQGRVLEFTATALVLETPKGRAAIPARICLQERFTLVDESASDIDGEAPTP